jgi:prophage antirepressor-like protein
VFVDEDQKGLRNVQTLGGMQQMVIVSEDGVYKIASVSRKPIARRETVRKMAR